MRGRLLLRGVVLMGAVAFVAGQVVSQEKSKGDAEQEQMMQAWMKYSQPGKFHAYLEPLAGHWTQHVKWWMAPGAPPEESTSTCEYKWILGGRFLMQKVKEEAKGAMDHPPFEGLGMIGYDNFKKKYTSMWTDNMTTAIMTSFGTCDASGKVFTFIGKHDDVFAGKADQMFKTVTRIINKDKHVGEMYMTGPDGKEFKTLEITYTRK